MSNGGGRGHENNAFSGRPLRQANRRRRRHRALRSARFLRCSRASHRHGFPGLPFVHQSAERADQRRAAGHCRAGSVHGDFGQGLRPFGVFRDGDGGCDRHAVRGLRRSGLSAHAFGDFVHVAHRGAGQRFPCDETRHVAVSRDARDDDRASGPAFRLDARRPLGTRSAGASVGWSGSVFWGPCQFACAGRPHPHRLGRARQDAVRAQGLHGRRRPARCGARGRKRRPYRDRLLRRQRSACGHRRAGARRLCQRCRQLGGSRLRARLDRRRGDGRGGALWWARQRARRHPRRLPAHGDLQHRAAPGIPRAAAICRQGPHHHSRDGGPSPGRAPPVETHAQRRSL